MKIQLAPKATPATPIKFIERAHGLGLLSWSLDLNGMPTSDPDAPGPISMWMSSKRIRSLLTERAVMWAAMDSFTQEELLPGMWIFPYAEQHRNRRTGYCVLIGFSKIILESEYLANPEDTNPLQVSALKHLLEERICTNKIHATQTYQLLAWSLEDLLAREKHDETIDGFSDQLGNAYETITALHDLGMNMNSINDSNGFIHRAIEHVVETLEYEWAACVISEEHPIGQLLNKSLYQVGANTLNDKEIGFIVDRVHNEQPVAYADRTKIYSAGEHIKVLSPQMLVHPIEQGGEVFGHIVVGGKRGEDPQVSSHETKMLDAVSGILSAFLENMALYNEQNRTFVGTVKAMSSAIDAKDRYTQGHSERVAMLSAKLAEQIGQSENEIERIRISGLVHDVGKIGVPEAVLCKPGRLTDEEFDLIKLHPTIGYDILKDIPSLSDILPGVLHHHEKWDGTGYPSGLAGESIPLMARIMAIADTFDAMSSNRAYRAGMPRAKVLAEIQRCSGSQFDPELVPHFLAIDLGEYDAMVEHHAGQAAYKESA
ncbi:MAG: HD-GYP domain-containing protein [Phycisphaerales bacterium]|nr:HD-GYP domain-containing protein [Phycisphaerales bacterium]